MPSNRKRTFKIGFTAGQFSLIHAGYVMMFEECKKYCDYLIVGLQTDASIDRPHKSKPIMSLEERYRILRAIKWIDAIIIYETERERIFLESWLPYDIRFMGEDHKGRKHYGIKKPIIYTSRKHGYSSTELRKRIIESKKI